MGLCIDATQMIEFSMGCVNGRSQLSTFMKAYAVGGESWTNVRHVRANFTVLYYV